jgi:hypothetical protein
MAVIAIYLTRYPYLFTNKEAVVVFVILVDINTDTTR